MLTSNLFAWNILICFFISWNVLVNPGVFISGPKVFLLIYRSPGVLFIIASVIAIGTWLIEDILFYRFLARKSLGLLFFFRIFFITILLVVLVFIISVFHYHEDLFFNQEKLLQRISSFIWNRVTFYFLLVGISISWILNSFKIVAQKVGAEKFFRIISGYYRTPREEDRIFIFIDLISSTRYAEKLGHERYSFFLLECFQGIGILQVKYKGTQYQFVGDEVVISWPARRKQNYKNAVDFFFEFKQLLAKRSEYFEQEFGLVPRFTASINAGKIMMAEIGDLKSEIAFHGDVLNTAARIQKQCKCYNQELLVTKRFAEKLKELSDAYQLKWIADQRLTGKERIVTVYAVLHN